ncbi:MAG: alpha/beta fold hydrolase [Pseudomonadales bacterium]
MKAYTKLGSITLLLVAALAITGCAQSAAVPIWETLPKPAALPLADESGLANIDDIQMWYAIFNKGGGEPVLLVHGGLGSADNWGNQVSELAQHHQVIVADSRGHGRSTRSDKPFSYELMANDYVALLDYLKIERVAIVGWSDGGIIGLDIAMRSADRVAKLWAFGANTSHLGLKENFGEHPVFVAATAELGAEYKRLSPTPNDYDGFLAAIGRMWETQPNYKPEAISRIATPTVIAVGEYDEAIKSEHSEEIVRLIPGAKLLVLPSVSHYAPWQNPQLVNREIQAFLDSEA